MCVATSGGYGYLEQAVIEQRRGTYGTPTHRVGIVAGIRGYQRACNAELSGGSTSGMGVVRVLFGWRWPVMLRSVATMGAT